MILYHRRAVVMLMVMGISSLGISGAKGLCNVYNVFFCLTFENRLIPVTLLFRN